MTPRARERRARWSRGLGGRAGADTGRSPPPAAGVRSRPRPRPHPHRCAADGGRRGRRRRGARARHGGRRGGSASPSADTGPATRPRRLSPTGSRRGERPTGDATPGGRGPGRQRGPGRKPPQEPAPPPACVAGRYSPEKAGKWAFPTAPIYSLASRTKEFSNDQTPGRPGRAAWRVPPPPAGSRLRSDPSARPPTTPSLGARATRALLRSPLAQTPGPCNYRAVDSNVYKARAPQFSMLARNVLPGDNTQKPGPGTYSPEKHRGQTFGIRHSDYLAPLIVDVAD
uniref:Ciliary microtubule associated protein 1B n=1 Tax=Crocodylus porosus TaxID=8502 RepID=A0A7M4E6X6_CROPO